MQPHKPLAYQPTQTPPFVTPETFPSDIESLILTAIAYRDYGTSDVKLQEMLVGTATRPKYPEIDFFTMLGDRTLAQKYYATEPNPAYLDGASKRRILDARERLVQAKLLKQADYAPHTGDLTRKLWVLTEKGSIAVNDIYGGKPIATEEKTPEMSAAALQVNGKVATKLLKVGAKKRKPTAKKKSTLNNDGSKRKPRAKGR